MVLFPVTNVVGVTFDCEVAPMTSRIEPLTNTFAVELPWTIIEVELIWALTVVLPTFMLVGFKTICPNELAMVS